MRAIAIVAVIASCARPGSSCEQRRIDAEATVMLAIEAVRIDTTKALRAATDAQNALDNLHQHAGEVSDQLARMIAAGCDHAPLCCATLATSHAALPFAVEDHAGMQPWSAAYATFAGLYNRRADRDELAKACADANAAFAELVAAAPANAARDTARAKAELDAANQAANASTQLEAVLASWSAGLGNSAAVEPQPIGSAAGDHAHVAEAELAVQTYAQVCGR